MELLFNLSLFGLVVVCLLMTLLILMQKPKQEGLGAAFGGGMTQDMFGAHTVTVLQKGTVYLAIVFFVLAGIVAWSGARLGATATVEADYESLEAADTPAPVSPVAAGTESDESPGVGADGASREATAAPEPVLEEPAATDSAADERLAPSTDAAGAPATTDDDGTSPVSPASPPDPSEDAAAGDVPPASGDADPSPDESPALAEPAFA